MLVGSFLALLCGAALANECGSSQFGNVGDFDLYLLQHTWTPKYCNLFTHEAPPNCEKPSPSMKSGLTIHGFWPEFTHARPDLANAFHGWPECCSSPQGTKLPADVVSSMMNTLGDLWPDLREHHNASFSTKWDHEWARHGTCTGLSPRDYLQTAIQLTQSMGSPPVFAKAIKSHKPKLSHKRRDLEKHFNGGQPCAPGGDCSVVLHCMENDLVGVTTCWGKDLTSIPCPQRVKDSNNHKCQNRVGIVGHHRKRTD